MSQDTDMNVRQHIFKTFYALREGTDHSVPVLRASVLILGVRTKSR